MKIYHCSSIRIAIIWLNTTEVILLCYISIVFLLQPDLGSSYLYFSCLHTGIHHPALFIQSTPPSQSLSLILASHP